jgi:hypothetical protein
VSLGLSIHPGDTQLHGTLIVNLHHGADGLRQRRIQGHGKVQADDRARFDQFIERRQDDTVRIGGAWLAVVEFLRRTEDTAHVGVGLEEREEDDDALDDGGLDLGAKELPVLPVPILDAVEAVPLLRVDRACE